jgi:hypothetical protein
MRCVKGFAAAFACVAGFTVTAQTTPTPFAKSFCIKVQPGKNAEFMKLMTDVSKPVAQVRADAGEYSTLFLMRAVYPAGMEAACDYELVTLYPGFPPDPKTAMAAATAYEKAHVAMKPSEFTAQRDALSRLRKSELWRVRASLGIPENGNYVRHNYVKVQPDDMAQWLKLEEETFKPVHQARIEFGAFKGWALTTLAMPSGSELPYNAMTVDWYKDWSSIGAPTKYQEAFQKAGKGEMSAAFAQSSKLRGAFVRTELYEIVYTVTPRSASHTSSGQQ